MTALKLTKEPPVLEGTPSDPVRAATTFLAPSPNPAKNGVVFRFSLATRAPAKIVVFDVQGRRIATALDRTLEPGPHEVIWTRGDLRDSRAWSGVYFARFEAEGQRFIRRFVLVR
jgi:hypothetical protein